MTRAELTKVALSNGGYSTPYLNDSLFLSFRGYRRIESLEAYTGLKALYGESNGFTRLEGLEGLGNLRSLYLSRNLVSKIEGLGALKSLVTLDLSENRLTKIEGLSSLPNLSTLNVAKNALKDVDSIRHLVECKALTSVDLSNNCISTIGGDGNDNEGNFAGNDADDITVVDLLSKCHGITALNMAGNPVVGEVSHFRKKLIVALKSLKSMDRPVFDQERAMAEAWAVGGREAEARTKKEWQEKERNANRKGLEDYRQWQERMRKEAEEKPAKIRDAENEERNRKKEQRLVEAQKEAVLERQKYALDSKGKVAQDKDDVEDDDDDDDEGPPPLTDATNVGPPTTTFGSEAIDIDIDTTKVGGDVALIVTEDDDDEDPPPLTDTTIVDSPTTKLDSDVADKDIVTEKPSDPPVSSPTSIAVKATTKEKDGTALIQESLAILRKQKQCVKMMPEDSDTGFAWSDELDSALIRHATATSFDPDETIARLSKDFPKLVPSLDESLFMQRLEILGLLEPKEKGRDQGAGEDRSPTTTTSPTTTAAVIPPIAGKQELLKSNATRRIVLPPVKLPSSCDNADDITLDPGASLDAYLKQRGGLHVAVEKECVEEEDGKEVLDVSIASAESDIFYDAKETLTPIK